MGSPKCPLTDEWIQKTGLYEQRNITQPEKIEILPFLPWLDMGGIMLCETSQRKANTTYYNLHVGI